VRRLASAQVRPPRCDTGFEKLHGCLISVHAITTDDDLIDDLVNARGHFPTETAALKCVYLAIMSLDPTGRGRQRWSNRWKEALNALEITFDGRLSANRK
jgi:putative transposase